MTKPTAPVSPDEHKRVVIVGAGRVGRAAAELLAADLRYVPLLADIDRDALRLCKPGIATAEIGYSLVEFLRDTLPGAAAVICAIPSGCATVAEAARAAGCHYIDLADDTGDAAVIERIARGASTTFVTSCGFSPGYVTALLRTVLEKAGPGSDIAVQVGVLPAERTGRLGYGDLWGVGGLINEYTRPCLALRKGQVTNVPPLGELETVTILGSAFEAFTTAGTLDNLVREQAGRIGSLTYKTIRYPGHLDYIRFLLEDMGLGERVHALKSLLLNALKKVDRDRAIIRISHRISPDAEEEVILREFHAVPDGSGGWISAVSRISAAHACAVLDVTCSSPGLPAGHLHGDIVPPGTLAKSPLFDI